MPFKRRQILFPTWKNYLLIFRGLPAWICVDSFCPLPLTRSRVRAFASLAFTGDFVLRKDLSSSSQGTRGQCVWKVLPLVQPLSLSLKTGAERQAEQRKSLLRVRKDLWQAVAALSSQGQPAKALGAFLDWFGLGEMHILLELKPTQISVPHLPGRSPLCTPSHEGGGFQ